MSSHDHLPYSICATCQGLVRRPVVCPFCGKPACRWVCYDQHLSGHGTGRQGEESVTRTRSSRECPQHQG